MLAAERHAEILRVLRDDRRLVASDLVARLGVSRETVRRDLDDLAAAGLVSRVHGGALPPVDVPPTYAARLDHDTDEKARLAGAAMLLLQDGQVIVLAGGTTMQRVAQRFPDIEATVFVTSPPAVAELARRSRLRIQLVGGTLSPEGMYVYGDDAVAALGRVNADIALISPFSIHPEKGVTVPHLHEVGSFSAIIQSAATVVALTTSEKLDTVTPYRAASLGELTHLIVDGSVSEETITPYRSAGLQILRSSSAVVASA
jgi:DeoR/GlpR family transcriptional regulator of sugar metabolism